MSKMQKRLERLLRGGEDRWDVIKTILEYYGCGCDPPDGDSHWAVYHNDIQEPLIIPVHNNRIKRVYIKRIIRFLECIEEGEDRE